MPVPLSSAARTILSQPSVRVGRSLEIVRELLNADLRQSVDVTGYVTQWGTISGDSTLRKEQWEIPGASFTLSAEDRYVVPGAAESLWEALGEEPTDCWVTLRLFVTLPSGAEETLHTYYGKIENAAVDRSAERFLVSIDTTWAGHEAMAAGVTKQSGDAVMKEGSTW